MEHRYGNVSLILKRPEDETEEARALADLVSATLETIVKAPEIVSASASLPSAICIEIVLAGEDAFQEWVGSAPAVGFLAIGYPIVGDEPDDEGFDVTEAWEVSEAFRVVACDRVPSERLDGIEIAAWLTTVPHEILHAIAWATSSGGRTPLEVFDMGVDGLAEDRAVGEIGRRAELMASEDEIEDAARKVVDRLPQAIFDETWAAIAAVRTSARLPSA